jgi:hypothetical protein
MAGPQSKHGGILVILAIYKYDCGVWLSMVKANMVEAL